MTNSVDNSNCTRWCWVISVVAGVVIALLLMGPGGWGFWISVVIGLVVLAVAGVASTRLVCPDGAATAPAPAPVAAPAPRPAAPEPAPEPQAAPAPEPEPVEQPAATAPAAASGLIKPSTALPGQQELADRKGAWRYAPEAGSADAGGQGPDDLKRIRGVGPALERKLNDAGVTRFAQIAAWSDDDVARIDDLLSFPGRVLREDWIGQAKSLAAGG